MTDTGDEVLPGLWQFSTDHPEWTEDEGGEEGWEPGVVRTIHWHQRSVAAAAVRY